MEMGFRWDFAYEILPNMLWATLNTIIAAGVGYAIALVALVTVVDLTFEAKQINSITWLSAQCFGTALLIYYIIARFALVPFLRWLEVLAARKVGRGKA